MAEVWIFFATVNQQRVTRSVLIPLAYLKGYKLVVLMSELKGGFIESHYLCYDTVSGKWNSRVLSIYGHCALAEHISFCPLRFLATLGLRKYLRIFNTDSLE